MAMLLAACSSFPSSSGHLASTDPTLVTIDSLLWSQPDSAFARLQDFDANHAIDSLDTFNRHYFHLLLSELLYKNDYPQTNRNELLHAVDYYDSLVAVGGTRVCDDLAFIDARAHYIEGAGYYEMDSVVPACEHYLKALEVMEEHSDEKELVGKKAQFMALAYTRLTELFSDQYLHGQAIYFGENTLHYYGRYDAPSMYVGWGWLHLGLHYDILGNYDEAEYCYDNALEVVSDTNNALFRDIAFHLVFLSYERGGNPQESIARMTDLLDLVNDENELVTRYLTIGEVFYHEKEFDSAKVYLTSVYDKTLSLNQRKQAAEWLSEICKELDEQDESAIYAEFLVPFANQEENLSARKSAIIQHYEQFVQDKQDRSQQQRRDQNTKWTLLNWRIGHSIVYFCPK